MKVFRNVCFFPVVPAFSCNVFSKVFKSFLSKSTLFLLLLFYNSHLTFCLIRPGYVFCILLLTSISCLGTNIESIKNPTGKLDAMIYTCFVFLYIYMCKIQRMCLGKLSCTYYYKYLLFKYLCNIYTFH